ncbi:MAG: hypothetical protein FGM32_07250 [Candidatus Kapabacteria bacterium]|nr:hypothetical protein [Candidatus Kapabacteria bacterium]
MTYFRTSVLPYFRTSVLPYFRTSVLPYFRTSVLPYFRTCLPSLSHCPQILILMRVLHHEVAYGLERIGSAHVPFERAFLPHVNDAELRHRRIGNVIE